MEYRSIKADGYESVRRFLCDAGWRHRLADAEKFKKMIGFEASAVVMEKTRT